MMQYYSNTKNYVSVTKGQSLNGKGRRQTYSPYNGNNPFLPDNESMGLLTEVLLIKLFSKSSSVFPVQQTWMSHFTPFLE